VPEKAVAEVIGSIQAAFPDHRLASLFAPTVGRPVFVAYVEKSGLSQTILVSSSGEVLGERPESGFVMWVLDLHVDLLAGRAGRIVNGFGALLLLLLCATGLFIWWPGRDSWQRAIRVDFRRNWRRVVWETHSAAGFWTVLLIGMWAVTAVYFSFPGTIQRVVNRLSPLSSTTAGPSDPSRGPERAAIGSLVEAAATLVPDGQVAGVLLPGSSLGPVVVQMSRGRPNHLDTSDYVHVSLDQYSGSIIGTWDARDRSVGDALLAWMGPLHFGNFGGVAVKVLWVVLGLTPALLFVTGSVMWWNRVLRRKWSQMKAA
jgi:uncharacterized iron-regulated membrane protein